jgi:hypothetical protein
MLVVFQEWNEIPRWRGSPTPFARNMIMSLENVVLSWINPPSRGSLDTEYSVLIMPWSIQVRGGGEGRKQESARRGNRTHRGKNPILRTSWAHCCHGATYANRIWILARFLLTNANLIIPVTAVLPGSPLSKTVPILLTHYIHLERLGGDTSETPIQCLYMGEQNFARLFRKQRWLELYHTGAYGYHRL